MPLKKEEGNILLDFYESLLTEKQTDILSQYYRLDYSLSEIAENMNVSRSAISDLINRTDNQLLEYESKLGLVKKHNLRQKVYDKYRNNENQKMIDELINLE